MGEAWFLLTKLHSLAWPGLTLAYPLYASIKALEGNDTSKPEVEQWLAYWIMYALLSPLEMNLEPLLQWIPFWYDWKLLFVAWLVLPQFGGACFLYEKFAKNLALRVMGHKDHRRHQVATSRPSQPAPENARDKSTNQSDTVDAHPSNTTNGKDIWEGQSKLVHKQGKRRFILSWNNVVHRRHSTR